MISSGFPNLWKRFFSWKSLDIITDFFSEVIFREFYIFFNYFNLLVTDKNWIISFLYICFSYFCWNSLKFNLPLELIYEKTHLHNIYVCFFNTLFFSNYVVWFVFVFLKHISCYSSIDRIFFFGFCVLFEAQNFLVIFFFLLKWRDKNFVRLVVR